MTIDHALLTALQYGDSQFPSGTASFSWGLEPAHRDGLVRTAGDVTAFIRTQIQGRWRPFDRPVMCAAYRMTDAPGARRDLDLMVERMTIAEELREGSKKAGAASLACHAKLKTPGVESYYREVRLGSSPGHLPVAQGVIWFGVGLNEDMASAISAHGMVVGMLSAALRLNLIGHVTAQALRRELQADIAEALDNDPGAIDAVSTFAPLAEIAAMRHPAHQTRLFAT